MNSGMKINTYPSMEVYKLLPIFIPLNCNPHVGNVFSIKEINVNFYTPTTETAEEGVGSSKIQEHIYIRPGLTADGNPTTVTADSIPIAEISADDDYGFIVDFVSDLNDNT